MNRQTGEEFTRAPAVDARAHKKAMVVALMLIPTVSATPLKRRLQGCDVRYLKCLQDVRSTLRQRADGTRETADDHMLAMYGCCPHLRESVSREAVELFSDVDATEPVVIVSLSKWWWAARVAANALDGAGARDLTLLAFSPILSLDPRDFSDDHVPDMAPTHLRVLKRWDESPMVQMAHGERLVLPPDCQLTLVYPRLNEPDRLQVEAPDVSAWLRHRPQTSVVPLECRLHSNVFLFVPSIEIRDNRILYVNESSQRVLSSDEIQFIDGLRAYRDGALHLDRAILDHASFVEALQAFTGGTR